MFSDHGLEDRLLGISPGHKVIDPAVGMAVDDPRDHVGKVGHGLDVVELGGFDERGDGRPMFGSGVRAGERWRRLNRVWDAVVSST